MIGSIVAVGWLTSSGICSLALGRFRLSVIAKYTAPLHLVCLCIAALFLSWQTMLYLLTANLCIASAISRLYGEYREDRSAELPDLKNQLEALAMGPPYNFLCGRLYPKESIPPLAMLAHTIDLLWRYLNRRPGPDIDKEIQELEAQARATYERLCALEITDARVLPEEKELLYWHRYISPIDHKYALETKPALLLVRIMLGEPLPTKDLKSLALDMHVIASRAGNSVCQDPKFPEVRAWVLVYNREPALEIEHLAQAFLELWSETTTRKVLFILMRDYGLKPCKKLQIPRRESLAFQIQSEYVLPHVERAPQKAKHPDSYSSPIEDRFGLCEILYKYKKEWVVPYFDWNHDFVVDDNVPDFFNPFFKATQLRGSDDLHHQEEWQTETMQSLLKGLEPFDGRGTTLWRLHLLNYFNKANTESMSLKLLCKEPNRPSRWRFAFNEKNHEFTGSYESLPIYRRWRGRVQQLVHEVMRKYKVRDEERALQGIARAFNMEWDDPASPLRALAFIEKWPLDWWLKVIERSLLRLANQKKQPKFLELCEK